MPSAAIKFVQGLSLPPAGEALIGVLTTPVVVSNGNNSGVATWAWTFLDVPPGSAIPSGFVSSASSFVFAPDLRGGYHIELVVTDANGVSVTDRRVFQVQEPSGHVIPPFDALAPALNFSAQRRGWAKYLEELLRYLLANVGGSGDLLFAGGETTASTIYTRAGARPLQADATKVYRFKATIETSLATSSYYVQVRLFDITHNVAVTGTTMDNSALSSANRATATEFTSAALTVGAAAGNLRSDVSTTYEVQFRVTGTVVDTASEWAVISNARLAVSNS